MRILVTGSRGQLGCELCRRFAQRAAGLSHDQLDITDRQAVESRLASLRPDVVINTAAYNAVDRAESDAAACQAVNADAVGHLAEACRRIDATLVQISTNYVFGDDAVPRRPYRESDPPAPLGVYACSKLAGERLAAACPRHLIIRTCGLYGQRPPGVPPGNFVDTMLRFGRQGGVVRVVNDQHCTPSSAADVAAAIQFLVETSAVGLFHVTSGGATTWYTFAAEIFRRARLAVNLEPISSAEFAAPAARPAYSVLDTTQYHALNGPPMSPWQAALGRYLAEIGAAPHS
ncbi:MAG TPA: dTDP-4-dehydrorhamnose reductase [Pirellulales bacterium]|jgi:dTDP-4-dehydrorhamnose reductase|nr:dTDP-4-dehydrorhamnose reductase [Pirellulales bacterium]